MTGARRLVQEQSKVASPCSSRGGGTAARPKLWDAPGWLDDARTSAAIGDSAWGRVLQSVVAALEGSVSIFVHSSRSNNNRAEQKSVRSCPELL